MQFAMHWPLKSASAIANNAESLSRRLTVTLSQLLSVPQQTGIRDLHELIGLHAFAKLRVEILGGCSRNNFLDCLAFLAKSLEAFVDGAHHLTAGLQIFLRRH